MKASKTLVMQNMKTPKILKKMFRSSEKFVGGIEDALQEAVRAGMPSELVADFILRRTMQTLLVRENGNPKRVRDILFRAVNTAVSLANDPKIRRLAKQALEEAVK